MKAKDSIVYPAVFTYEPNQEIAVIFPDLGTATSGIDEEDALASARECLGLVIYGLEDDDELIPPASKLQDVKTAANERVVLIDAYMPAVRSAQENRNVTKTVAIPAWLNAKAAEHDIDFSQTLQRALCEQLQI